MSKKVTLDYGHGGKDPGAQGNNLREKDLTLEVGKEVKKVLERHKVQVVETRSNDKFLELSDRAKIANNNKVDVFVSIHVNSFSNSTAQGLETFSYPGSINGRTLARNIQDEVLKSKLYTKDRGIKTANFAVLRLTNAPAALIEMGFISNKADMDILTKNKEKYAEAIAKGILKYLGIKYVASKPSTPSKPSSDKGFYRVVVGSYKNKKNAEDMQKELKKKGFDSFLAYYEK